MCSTSNIPTELAATLALEAQRIISAPRGILAADQEPQDMDRILRDAAGGGGPSGWEARLAFRKWTLAADHLGRYLGGVILHYENVTTAEFDFAANLDSQNIALGGTVDQGFVHLEGANEPVTQDIDALDERLAAYKARGCKFVKWRTVIQVSSESANPQLPSDEALETNLDLASHYAAAAQAHGLVPICEPDLSYAGDFPAERFRDVAEKAWVLLFRKLADRNVHLPGIILKTSWVAPGFGHTARGGADDAECARMTVDSVARCVPREVAGVAFLSGGMGLDRCVAFARMITAEAAARRRQASGDELPRMSFSYGRSLLEAPASEFAKRYEEEVMGEDERAVAAVGDAMVQSVRLASEASVEV